MYAKVTAFSLYTTSAYGFIGTLYFQKLVETHTVFSSLTKGRQRWEIPQRARYVKEVRVNPG